MSFREKIEAQLQAKDAARFKAAMDMAAKAVGHLERQEQEATAQSELLDRILAELEDQSYQTTMAIVTLAHSVDNLSEEMRELAASTTAANVVMKKSGSNAVFLGQSWAFWKDRLSLTRSEVYTTALTIGTYLSPALIAMGSSFAYAAVGGGGVAAAGMASFLGGLAGIISIASPVSEGLDKIKKAHEQLNVTIDQYGAASIQASRANARLYAIIDNYGGPAVANLLSETDQLKDRWAGLTSSGRANYVDMLRQMLGGANKLAPAAASMANQSMAALRASVMSVMPDLTGKEAKEGIRVIGDIFRSSIGPGVRGAANALLVFFRVIKASAPWVKRLSSNWERMTKSWRDRATQGRVNKFMNEAVNHFRAWWGLAKALARTLMLVFKGSRREGQGFVVELTHVVDKFNDWLQAMEDTGRVEHFFETYIKSLKDVAAAFRDPMAALDTYMPQIVAGIDKYLPQLMDVIAENLAQHGPAAAGIFLQAFVDAGAWAKFLTVALFAYKFGFFGALGKRAALIFIGPFATAFATSFAAQLTIQTAAGGTIAGAMSTAGHRSGILFGRGLIVGIIAAIPAITYELEMAVINALGPLGDFYKSLGKGEKNEDLFTPKGIWDRFKDNFSLNPNNWGKAAGGVIFPGQSRWVGEKGPEIARATTSGALITPNSRASAINIPPTEIPDLSDIVRLSPIISVQVDRREIARAVSDQRAYDAARRGQEDEG